MSQSTAADPAIAIDVVVLTALEMERVAVVRALGDCAEYPWRGSKLARAALGDMNVLVVPLEGMGNTNSAYVSTFAFFGVGRGDQAGPCGEVAGAQVAA
ncbi:hypothetical protein [Nocardia seriolae]|uniref:hypothetical protein n=1 Tax=Nocardia seriolae TaxID=37332 RepID=UPI000BBB002D|nr:hypothetical protein [Nocardia seriolae]MTJ64402.1 hypothetical protein [Nocardia seriolae]RLP22555.1 hypothetical protein D6158_35915 [Nocardia seriolae]WKY55135.1 hypothetical protein Q5P07_14585 [Nocardia seriolae]BEK89367.1 hypothetical protein NSERKGN1266_53180 [Nocardia seriolae]